MTLREIIHLERQFPVDTVVLAIAPVDYFTGAIIRGPVTAEITGLGVRASRNLSGMLVFVHREDRGDLGPLDPLLTQERYSVAIRARAAGYFDSTLEVDRPPEEAPDSARLKSVKLHRVPSERFGKETTLVRGVVLADGVPLDAAAVDAVVAMPDPDPGPGPDDPLPFRTRTDSRGDFALPVRLPDQTPGQTDVAKEMFWFRFSSPGLPHQLLKRPIADGGVYSFGLPIDLEGDFTLITPLLMPSRP